MSDRLGLIAGSGAFPVLLAKSAKEFGLSITAVAIKGDTSAALAKFVKNIHWINAGQLGRLFSIFKEEGITKAVMAGQVNPRHLFNKRLLLDERLNNLLESLRDKRCDSILGALAYDLEAQGIELIDSTIYLKNFMVTPGVLTRPVPTAREKQDISFGAGIAKAIANIDIGQTVCVKEKSIIAIEAVDGTDATILRAGRIAGSGVVVIKVSKPRQDMRFDIPVIGLRTIKVLKKAKATCLAVESEKTLFLEKEQALCLADKNGISIAGI